jgi:outer membrane immunogenic protein
MKIRLLLVCGLSCLSVPAMAADLIIPSYTPEVMSSLSVHDWSGFYVGASAGYGWASSNAAVDDESGPGVALQAGYNHDFGSWVAGARAEFVPSSLAEVEVNGRELGNAGRVVGTAGVKIGDTGSTLAYGMAGVGIATSSEGDEDFTDYGWTVGAGVAQALTENVSVFGEVSYARFDDVADTKFDVDGVGVAAGVAYRF